MKLKDRLPWIMNYFNFTKSMKKSTFLSFLVNIK